MRSSRSGDGFVRIGRTRSEPVLASRSGQRDRFRLVVEHVAQLHAGFAHIGCRRQRWQSWQEMSRGRAQEAGLRVGYRGQRGRLNFQIIVSGRLMGVMGNLRLTSACSYGVSSRPVLRSALLTMSTRLFFFA